MIKCTFHLKLFQFDKDTQNKLIYWYPTFFLPCKTLFFTGDLIQKFQNVQFRWVILPACDRKIGNSQVKLTCNHGRQTHFYLDLSISSQLWKLLKKNINIGKIIIMLFYKKNLPLSNIFSSFAELVNCSQNPENVMSSCLKRCLCIIRNDLYQWCMSVF